MERFLFTDPVDLDVHLYASSWKERLSPSSPQRFVLLLSFFCFAATGSLNRLEVITAAFCARFLPLPGFLSGAFGSGRIISGVIALTRFFEVGVANCAGVGRPTGCSGSAGFGTGCSASAGAAAGRQLEPIRTSVTSAPRKSSSLKTADLKGQIPVDLKHWDAFSMVAALSYAGLKIDASWYWVIARPRWDTCHESHCCAYSDYFTGP